MPWLPVRELELKFGAPRPGSTFGPLEHRACPSCGSIRNRIILPSQYYALADLDTMAVVECENCSLMFTNPIPSKMWLEGFLDPSVNIWWDQPVWTTLEWQGENSKEKFDDGLRVIGDLAPTGGALIDVGTGPGLFVKMALEAGYDAMGLDVLAEGLRRAAGNGIPVTGADLRDPRFDERFDIVTLWCVIAHEPAFVDLVTRCHQVLKPGGIVLVETPNMTLWRRLKGLRSLLKSMFRRKADHDSVAAYLHINHFTTRTLRDLLARCGFADTRFHLIGNYRNRRGAVDLAKRLLFEMSGSRLNVAFPLVASARKPHQ